VAICALSRSAAYKRAEAARDAQFPEPQQQEDSFVADVAFTVATLAFFAVAILYLRGCERLK
jgi:hypothetical protein